MGKGITRRKARNRRVLGGGKRRNREEIGRKKRGLSVNVASQEMEEGIKRKKRGKMQLRRKKMGKATRKRKRGEGT